LLILSRTSEHWTDQRTSPDLGTDDQKPTGRLKIQIVVVVLFSDDLWQMSELFLFEQMSALFPMANKDGRNGDVESNSLLDQWSEYELE